MHLEVRNFKFNFKFYCRPYKHPHIKFSDVHQLLKGVGKSLSDFPMLPQPPPIYLNTGTNNLILDDTNYNVEDMRSEYEALINNCNEEQLLSLIHI